METFTRRDPVPDAALGDRVVALVLGLALVGTVVAAVRAPHVRGDDEGSPDVPRLALAAVDVNAADAALLRLLPGIGPVLSERIARERVRRGGYARFEDLLDVSGIGPARLADLRADALLGSEAGSGTDPRLPGLVFRSVVPPPVSRPAPLGPRDPADRDR